MGRAPCCEKVGLKKGPWTPEEDLLLINYITERGHASWRALPKKAGLLRCGKSCRLRWTNYLRPDIKRGDFSPAEEQTIIHLHALLGNRWSAIASQLPNRTDNEIKNHWNTHLKKTLSKMGIDPITHRPKTGILMEDIGALSHMAQWESARLEAEARLSREAKLRAEGLWPSPPACTLTEHNRKTGINWADMATLMQNWEKSLQGQADLTWGELWKSTKAESSVMEDPSEKFLCPSGYQQLDATASCATTSTSVSSKLDQGSPASTLCCTHAYGLSSNEPPVRSFIHNLPNPPVKRLNWGDNLPSTDILPPDSAWPSLCAQSQGRCITEAASSSLAENGAIDSASVFDTKVGGNTQVGLPLLQDVDLDVLPCDTTSMLGNGQLPSLKMKCETQYLVLRYDELSDLTETDNLSNPLPNPVNPESSLLSSTAQSFSALLNDDFADDWSSMLKEDMDDSMGSALSKDG